ncbi:MAG: thiamine-phosphate kinase, partial [Microbacteriaceae bacterium]|nr:thiamine-phosphate kinase [Microbacteriaceae bacterium]
MNEDQAPTPWPTVGELGERGVLSRVLAQLSAADAASVGPGDDAAVLSIDGELVITSDTMIEGPDFRLQWHAGYDLGWKLAATNLSDVAAMGARPIALTVSLACPAGTRVALLEEIARGLDEACRALAPGCGVVGGDLGTAPVLTAAVTALGDLQGRAAVLRSGAKPGDVVAYCGQLGLAGLGLAQLFAGDVPANGDRVGADPGAGAGAEPGADPDAQHSPALAAQLRPQAPVSAGVSAAEAGATAMMDVSDGLSLDAQRMAEASGVMLDFTADQLRAAFGEQQGVRVPIDAML